jgi:cytosine/adenosine deaminase-related metal-dependent hydrolase
MTTKLLQGGTALIHDEDDHIQIVKADILIENDRISKISPNISTPQGAEVIDCTDKIISPGFIDTHRHLWQTQLKGRHANETLTQYMYSGNWQSSNFSVADFFWGQLGGCLESLDAGTTTVVDHAHLTTSADAAKMAVSATASSGIRAVFCFTPITRLEGWNPVRMKKEFPLAPWVLETFEDLASKGPYGEGRVTIGLAFDLWFLPKDVIASLFKKSEDLGVKTTTHHYVRNAQGHPSSMLELTESYGLLDGRMIFSHASALDAKDAELLLKRKAFVSSTPSTEIQMAMGEPTCFREDMRDIQGRCSLGVDCHSNQAGSIVSEMRLALQNARGVTGQKFVDKGLAPVRLSRTVEEAFNLGTVNGARAVHMEKDIGSIAVGKKADLVIFGTLGPAMVCAAQQDPVAAIVLHSSPGDISDVLVDGIFRKREGRLVPVKIEEDAQGIAKKPKWSWPDVAKELVMSRKEIQAKIDQLDFKDARAKLIELHHTDESKLVEKL